MAFDIEGRRTLALGLKTARKRCGLSALRAASLMAERGLKCTRGTLLAWERGAGVTSREPFASDLTVIASVYGCSVQDFFSLPSRIPPPHLPHENCSLLTMAPSTDAVPFDLQSV